MESLAVVEWCGLCNERPADGTLTIVATGDTEEVPVPCCVYCAANPKIWEDGKVRIKERPDE